MDGVERYPGAWDLEAIAGAFCPSVTSRVTPASGWGTLLYSSSPLSVSA